MTSDSAAAAALPGLRPFSRAAVVIVGLLLGAAVFLLGSAFPASAHDELSSSNPEPGAAVEEVPEAIELTFNNVPATIGSEVQVLDESGEDWAEGEVSITDAVASQAIRPGAPAGTYTVNWRVVSSDSHPIEGTFEFTASSGGAETPAASVGTAEPIETAEADAPESDATAGAGPSWAVIVMVAVLVVLAVVLALGARRRLKQGNNDAG